MLRLTQILYNDDSTVLGFRADLPFDVPQNFPVDYM